MTTATSPTLTLDHTPSLRASGPKVLLHLEGAAMFAAATTWYFHAGGGFPLFAALILVPDLALLGYLAGKRVGAIAYNTTHSLVGSLLLLGAGLFLTQPLAMSIALIWIAHIGVDRAVGYGLKYAGGARSTHLQRV